MEVKAGQNVKHITGESLVVVACSDHSEMVVCEDEYGERTTVHKDQLLPD